jgi:phospholipase C
MDENRNLDHLFGQYRTAVPDPEASANFMPELWRKIEARQFFLLRLKKLTQAFVVASAAICLLLGIVLQVPAAKQQVVSGNYVDVLASANPTENLSAVGIRIEYTEPDGR